MSYNLSAKTEKSFRAGDISEVLGSVHTDITVCGAFLWIAYRVVLRKIDQKSR